MDLRLTERRQHARVADALTAFGDHVGHDGGVGVQEQTRVGAEERGEVVIQLIALGLDRGVLVTADLGRVEAIVGHESHQAGAGVDGERRCWFVDDGGVLEVGSFLARYDEQGPLVAVGVGDADEAGDLVVLLALHLVEPDGLRHLVDVQVLQGLGVQRRLEDLALLAEDLKEDLPGGREHELPVGGVEAASLLPRLDGHGALELDGDVLVVVEVVVDHVVQLSASELALGVVVASPVDVVASRLEGRGDGTEQRVGQVALSLDADAHTGLGLGEHDLVEHHVGVLQGHWPLVTVRPDDHLAGEHHVAGVPQDDLLDVMQEMIGLLHDQAHEVDEGVVAGRNGGFTH